MVPEFEMLGPVVVTFNVTAELPLPEPMSLGLKLHVLSAGSPEHEKVTLFGNKPVVGSTLMVKLAAWPA